MFINEVSKITGLTKKAIEYYVERGLVSPVILENGYRDFTERQVEQLKKVAVLRKLGISTEDIKKLIEDEARESLHAFTLKKELDIQREQVKKSLLEKLAGGASYAEVSGELQMLENSKTITEKLLDAFPGYFGRLICLHFARFLNEPITTKSQQKAYEKVVAFLDNVPPIDLPADLQEYLSEHTKDFGTEYISGMIENVNKSKENPDEYQANNKELLEQYLAYKQSPEYKKTPAHKIMSLMKEFTRVSGYNDIFIPALKELSPSYAEYYRQLEIANEKLLAQYPEIKECSD